MAPSWVVGAAREGKDEQNRTNGGGWVYNRWREAAKAGIVANECKRIGATARFGVFAVDLSSGELYKKHFKVKLQEQPFQILATLLDHPGDIVTREELYQRLWSGNTFVDFEHSLNAAIKKLRESLEDTAENPRFIETVPRRGYRFIAPVTRADPSSASRPSVEAVAPGVGVPLPSTEETRRRSHGLIPVAVLAAILTAAGFGLHRTSRPERASLPFQEMKITKLTNTGTVKSAAISPDGQYVTYAMSDAAGQQSIWMRHLPSGSSVQVVPAGDVLYDGLTFSRDGNFVRYTKVEKNGSSGYYEMPLFGGVSRRLPTFDPKTPAVAISALRRNL